MFQQRNRTQEHARSVWLTQKTLDMKQSNTATMSQNDAMRKSSFAARPIHLKYTLKQKKKKKKLFTGYSYKPNAQMAYVFHTHKWPIERTSSGQCCRINVPTIELNTLQPPLIIDKKKKSIIFFSNIWTVLLIKMFCILKS